METLEFMKVDEKRVFVAILYALFLFMPAATWTYLYTGNQTLSGVASWVCLLLFIELYGLLGHPLNSAEAALVMLISGTIGNFFVFVNPMYVMYLRTSPAATSFEVASYFPTWFSPENADRFLEQRTFLVSELTLPILIPLIGMFLQTMASMALGYLGYELYSRTEKLPFPVQKITVSGIRALTEKDKAQVHTLVTSTIIGIFYSAFLYGASIIAATIGKPVSAPIPWLDLDRQMHYLLPGAAFGVATDLAVFSSGIVIPLEAIISILIGSALIWLVLNPIFVNFRISAFSEEYYNGMSVSLIMQRTWLTWLTLPIIGAGTTIALLPLIHRWRSITSAFRSLSGGEKNVLRLLPVLLLWLVPQSISIALSLYLAPHYPIWAMLVFGPLWGFLWTMVNSRSLGVAGVTIGGISGGTGVPTSQWLITYSAMKTSGHTSTQIIPAWAVTNATLVSPDGSGWCGNFKICELTGTSPLAFIKTYFPMFIASLIFGFIYVSLFWSMAPMPSAAFPATTIYWPISSITDSLLASGRVLYTMRWDFTVILSIVVTTLYIISNLTKIPFSVVAFVSGMTAATPIALTIFIGGLFNRFMEKFVFKAKWGNIRSQFAAGLILGEAIVLVASSSLALIIKSLLYPPY